MDWHHETIARLIANSAGLKRVCSYACGSNGSRVRAWKYALQEQVADRFDLAVTACHYPKGHFQMESHRTPTLQRDQQTLSGAASGQLSNPPALDWRSPNPDGSAGQMPSGFQTLRHRKENLRRTSRARSECKPVGFLGRGKLHSISNRACGTFTHGSIRKRTLLTTRSK